MSTPIPRLTVDAPRRTRPVPRAGLEKTVKYMMIMRATDAAIEASKQVPFEEMLTAMGAYNEALHDADVLRAGEGLSEPGDEANFVVDFGQEPASVSNGPYGDTTAQFNGFWIIEVSSKEEAISWASRCPLGPGMKLEVRRIHADEELQELAPENEYVKKEAAWREETTARTAEGS